MVLQDEILNPNPMESAYGSASQATRSCLTIGDDAFVSEAGLHLPMEGGETRVTVAGTIHKAGRGPDSGME